MSQPASRKRNALTLETIAAVWKYHLLAGMVFLALLLGSDLLVGREAFCRLGWWLGPFSYLPYPYGVEPQAASSGGTMWDVVMAALGVVFGGAVMSLFCGLTHGVGLLAAVGVHAKAGWPLYWRDARSRIDLEKVWLLSARRAWWAFPLGLCVSELVGDIAACLSYVRPWHSPVHPDDSVFMIMMIMGICYIFGVAASRLLCEQIVGALSREDLICVQCGYPLRGLPVLRCPECGYDAASAVVPEYGLLRRWPWRRTGKRNGLPVVVVLLLFLSSIYVPLGLEAIPDRLMAVAPAFIEEMRGYECAYDPNALPLRIDTMCVVHRGGSVAVVRFSQRRFASVDCESLYWSNEAALSAGRPPDLRTSYRALATYGTPGNSIPVGPWQFAVDGGEPIVTLHRPDASYAVEAFEPGHLPAYLRRLDEQGVWAAAAASLPAASQAAGSAPSSRPQGSALTASRPGE